MVLPPETRLILPCQPETTQVAVSSIIELFQPLHHALDRKHASYATEPAGACQQGSLCIPRYFTLLHILDIRVCRDPPDIEASEPNSRLDSFYRLIKYNRPPSLLQTSYLPFHDVLRISTFSSNSLALALRISPRPTPPLPCLKSRIAPLIPDYAQVW